jgi:putative nucleotidyltransferase with HDIG domain
MALAPPSIPPPVMERLSKVLKDGKLELPVLPAAASQVVQLCGDEHCDARKLTEVVTRDPAMAGNLMRLANSPAYAGSVPIVSLQQAISRLGFGKIRELALIISCQGKIFKLPGHEAWVAYQFRHALAAAGFAQEIARHLRQNVEEAFLCGLLHDVGRPVLLQTILDLHDDCDCKPNAMAVTVAINKLHSHVGSEMVKSWALPVRLAETIHHHHKPEGATTAAQTATLTCLADDLSHWALDESEAPGARGVAAADITDHRTLTGLNLYPEDLDALVAKKDQVLAMVKAMA